MDKERLEELLENVRKGAVSIDDALSALKSLPFEDLGYAVVDSHRALRKGYPEVIFCQNKSSDHIKGIIERMKRFHGTIMATRLSREAYESIKSDIGSHTYYETARILLVGQQRTAVREEAVLVVTAGTSDIPVAEEAAVTAEVLGNRVERLFDIGVAGIHRLFGNIDRILKASVLVVVAGMDGVLPSIIGGLVERPVIAVPTSVGYGASFEGLSALLTMLNSCAPGIAVVNIDNGFGAGYLAGMINRQGA